MLLLFSGQQASWAKAEEDALATKAVSTTRAELLGTHKGSFTWFEPFLEWLGSLSEKTRIITNHCIAMASWSLRLVPPESGS
jgi:hypothetical protein